jgi:hypothetical protein
VPLLGDAAAPASSLALTAATRGRTSARTASRISPATDEQRRFRHARETAASARRCRSRASRELDRSATCRGERRSAPEQQPSVSAAARSEQPRDQRDQRLLLCHEKREPGHPVGEQQSGGEDRGRTCFGPCWRLGNSRLGRSRPILTTLSGQLGRVGGRRWVLQSVQTLGTDDL